MKEVGERYRARMGKPFSHGLVEVKGLLEDRAKRDRRHGRL
jgi:hypothetical protein